ncbi:hypothetical protein D3C84_1229950 [compost metagenome]
MLNRRTPAKAAITAGLHPAKGHVRLIVNGRSIDVADARFHTLGQRQRARRVTAEDGRREAELRIVGQGQ